MRIDPLSLVLRLGIAWFFFTLTLLGLFLAGSAQSFLETTLALLFQALRWAVWSGALVSWFLLVPLAHRRWRRWAVSLGLGLGFSALFVLVLVWGSWVYPDAGVLAW
ncbi:MAG TPA: hypothetical protein VMB23_05090 [Spirochaetia bacterium]|nr:hypothetical protein [Spirochaetia bacterium]